MKLAFRMLGAFAAAATAAVTFAQAPAPTPPATPAAPAPAATPAPATAPPATSADAMDGLAAVYSDKLSGHKTASGQVLSQSALTAAHPSLPFGTEVKVTNTKNSKSVVVRINDRGPTQSGRVIDLTSTAAGKIGIGKKAMAPVKLDVVKEAPARK